MLRDWNTKLKKRYYCIFYFKLAEEPSIAREKKKFEKKYEKKYFKKNLTKQNKKIGKKISNFFACNTPRPPLSVHKKIEPNRSNRLYECLVLLYR